MSRLLTKSVAQQPHRKIEKRTIEGLIAVCTAVAAAVALLAVPVVGAADAQDKYSLKSPSGIPFSDFRGYEDWAVVSTAKTDVLKAIVADPIMIKAYKAGVPGNGQPFPQGSKIVKIQWKTKKSTEAPFDVDVPAVLAQVFRHGKGQQEVLEKWRRLGIRRVQLRTLHRARSRPIPKAFPTAATRAIPR